MHTSPASRRLCAPITDTSGHAAIAALSRLPNGDTHNALIQAARPYHLDNAEYFRRVVNCTRVLLSGDIVSRLPRDIPGYSEFLITTAAGRTYTAAIARDGHTLVYTAPRAIPRGGRLLPIGPTRGKVRQIISAAFPTIG